MLNSFIIKKYVRIKIAQKYCFCSKMSRESLRMQLSENHEVKDAGGRRLIYLVRLDPTVINGKFLKIGKDAEREFGKPCVTP